MDLRLYLRLFRRRWIAILLLTVLGTAVGAAAAVNSAKTYVAKTGIFVSTPVHGSDLNQAYTGSLLAQQQVKSYTTLITDDTVLRQLIGQLGLPYSVAQLRSEVHATNPTDTQVVNISVTDRSAQRATAIANAYGSTFAGFAATLSPSVPTATGGTSSSPEFTVTTLKPVELAPEATASHTALDLSLGLLGGLVLGIAWAVVREISDTRVRDSRDAADASGLPVLGTVPGGSKVPDRATLAAGQRRLSTVEAYRRLGINLQLSRPDRTPMAMVVTSPNGGEGTNAVATDLAISFAESGERVILVDADLHQAAVGGLLGLASAPGLCDVLLRRAPLEQALQSWRGALPLRVLTAGAPLPDTRDILRTDGLAALCDELLGQADIVILVAPPLLTETDTVLLARVVGQVLIVARSGITRRPALAESVTYLHSVGVAVSGVALSGVASRRGRRKNGPVPAEQPPARAGHPSVASAGDDEWEGAEAASRLG